MADVHNGRPPRPAGSPEPPPLEGIHHVSAITADAGRNLEFYTRVMGLRLVKKTVNQDDPSVYHLFYADEAGSPGADLTFFEYPGAPRGHAGAGMVHRISFRVGSDEAVGFWSRRLASEGIPASREADRLRFQDPEGLDLELLVDRQDQPLIAEHPEVPPEVALRGFAGVRAYATEPERSRSPLVDTLGFRPAADGSYVARGSGRGGFYGCDEAPTARGTPGAGTVHHVAWGASMEEHAAWRERVLAGGLHPTPVIDRFYFRSIYFREPGGVLFEIASLGPGFATDEAPAHLGERLSLPPAFEELRAEIQRRLTPLPDPRAAWTRR